ncbi:hypothetical protein SORBI_3008G185066 [Sorghum bicolor]|uniref:Uncharacterized protein n=1 Tax=Sorghum bicolor TaxID=4558 RepID=A0A1Z5R8D9_SORBI|nr:hypothetical protein SORBI_3008G185066 [Sorghum bicolor]
MRSRAVPCCCCCSVPGRPLRQHLRCPSPFPPGAAVPCFLPTSTSSHLVFC